MRKPNTKKLEQQVNEWNAKVNVGDEVAYYPLTDEPKFTLHKTRTEASILSGHTAVVWLEGKSGCVAIDHCKPVRATP